jgi:hypothetical protein
VAAKIEIKSGKMQISINEVDDGLGVFNMNANLRRGKRI